MKTFLYLHCLDLEPMRRFYSNVLGLDEIFHSTDEGAVGYQIGTLQLTIAVHNDVEPVDGWATQLGWKGGSTAAPSLGVELDSDSFRRAVQAVQSTAVDVHHAAEYDTNALQRDP